MNVLRFIHLLFLGITIVACQPTTSLPTNIIVTDRPVSISEVEPTVTLKETSINFKTDGIDLTITKPPEWETFSTEFGVVIAEKFGSVATGGVLEGLMAYTFVTPLTDFTVPAALDTNMTQQIFQQIVSDPNYMIDAAVSPIEGFEWNGNDAAYYLLNDGDGNVTLVLGVVLPDMGILLTSSISAPTAHSGRIRETLPDLLNGLQINGKIFSGDVVSQFPNPFQFPTLDE